MAVPNSHYDDPLKVLTDGMLLAIWDNLDLARCKCMYAELSDTECDSNDSVALHPKKKKGKQVSSAGKDTGRLTKVAQVGDGATSNISGRNTVNTHSHNDEVRAENREREEGDETGTRNSQPGWDPAGNSLAFHEEL
ncbi:hypothetical protein K439DRAFT_1620285 [Ramaria rubella]|nr:hypothetical protein K439DRAFT_1620285 [Ramaria rubella]